ncbi:MAG TPA: tellurite resistance TerB family protein [Alphaproteobacteria bacterium]
MTLAQPPVSPHAALIYTMILVSAVDGNMPSDEMRRIGQIVQWWPVFRAYDPEQLIETAQECAVMLQTDGGLDRVLAIIGSSIPSHLRETAYLVACDVAAVDGRVPFVESRMLARIRHVLGLDHLVAAALERAITARHARI